MSQQKKKRSNNHLPVWPQALIWSEKKRFCIHVFPDSHVCVFLFFFVSFVSSSKDQVSPAVVIYVLFKLALQPLTWQSWRGEREVFKIKGGNT